MKTYLNPIGTGGGQNPLATYKEFEQFPPPNFVSFYLGTVFCGWSVLIEFHPVYKFLTSIFMFQNHSGVLLFLVVF